MKIVHLILLCIVPLVCGKESHGNQINSAFSEDYIRVTFNGTEFLFNEKDYLQAFTGIMPDGRHFLTITGSIPDESMGASEGISIVIYSRDAIGEGVYLNGGFEDFGNYENLFFGPQLGFISNTSSAPLATDPNNPQSAVEILELNETGIKAVFLGTLINPVDRSTHSISNGELSITF